MSYNPVLRSSFSQHNMFSKYPRQWWFTYILKIPAYSDMSYANGGTVLHSLNQKYYNKQIVELESLKQEFNIQWDKFKLGDSIIKLKKDEYWLMVINAINLNLNITSTELKIYYPEIVAYLDAVDTHNDIIYDWKSSTRSEENEEEYKQQLMLYAWLYYRKFNRIPKKCIVYYLKYSGDKQKLEFTFNESDLLFIENWYYTTLKQMQETIANGKMPGMCAECNFFCPYKNLCSSEGNELKYTLHLEGSNIRLDGPISPLLHKGIEKKFSYELKNAFFMKRNNPYAKTDVKFWNVNKRILPIGFRDSLCKTLTDYAKHIKKDILINIEDHRQFDNNIVKMSSNFINGKELRDYQLNAVDVYLKNKISILQLGTGAGKTEVATEIIRRLGVKTLFVVDRKELMLQTKQRIENSLGIEVGIIGSGISNIKDITVATIQTLNKNLLTYKEYLSSVRFCIFDECHHVAAESFVKLSKYLINTEYRLGLSATVKRGDGNDMMINSVIGYIVYNLGSNELVDKGWLTIPTILFYKNYMDKSKVGEKENIVKTIIRNREEELNSKKKESQKGVINETYITLSDTEKYMLYYNEFILNNNERNNLLINIVNKHKNKKILILTKLIEHGQKIKELLAPIIDVEYLYGNTPKKEREEINNKFLNGNLSVLISTVSIWSEGMDIPNLDMVINVVANNGDIKTIQMLGRALRKIKGKTSAYYIDFIDETRLFKSASLSRIKALRNEGHEVKVFEFS